MDQNLDAVLAKLRWLREERIWPNGLRYLWTDAFGVTLLVSLGCRVSFKQFRPRQRSNDRRIPGDQAGMTRPDDAVRECGLGSYDRRLL